MIGALLQKNWLAALFILGVAAVLLLWHFDRKSQYLLGANEMRNQVTLAISKSKELTANEKNSAINSATIAALRVCADAGEDPRLCDDL